MREQIAARYAASALHPDGGSQSLGAARLVLGGLKSIDQHADDELSEESWFVVRTRLPPGTAAVEILEADPPEEDLPGSDG